MNKLYELELSSSSEEYSEILQGARGQYALYEIIHGNNKNYVYYSTVYRGIALPSGYPVAVKKIYKKFLDYSIFNRLRLAREIYVMNSLNNPHILRLRDFFQIKPLSQTVNDTGFYCIVTEFCNGKSYLGEIETNKTGDMLYFLNKRNAYNKMLTYTYALELFKYIIIGFSEFHSLGFSHRDIKLENIFLHDGIAIIGDFGFAKAITEDTLYHSMVGTFTTRAPETLIGIGDYDPMKSDIYSLGAIFYTLLTGRLPFLIEKDNVIELDNAIRNRYYRQEAAYMALDDDLYNLLDYMLYHNPETRIDLEKFYNHKIFHRSKDLFRYSTLLTENNVYCDINYISYRQRLQYGLQVNVTGDDDLVYNLYNCPEGYIIVDLEKSAIKMAIRSNYYDEIVNDEIKNVLALYINEVNIINELLYTVNYYSFLPVDKNLSYHILPIFMLLKRAYFEYIQLIGKLENSESVFPLRDPSHFFRAPTILNLIKRLKSNFETVSINFYDKLYYLRILYGWNLEELYMINDIYYIRFISDYKQVLKKYIEKILDTYKNLLYNGAYDYSYYFHIYALELCNCALLHNYYRRERIFDFLAEREKRRIQNFATRDVEITMRLWDLE